MKNISISYTQHENVIHIHDSRTGKREEIRLSSLRFSGKRKEKFISSISCLAAHIALQINTA